MRLLLVNKLYPPDAAGGAEAVTRSLALAHRRRGIDVTVATTTAGAAIVEDEVEQIPVVRLPLQNFFWHHESARRSSLARLAWHARDAQNRAMGRALGKLIARLRPHVVAFHNLAGFSSAAWTAARAAGLPAVQVLHDYYHLCPRSQLYARGRRCERRCVECKLFRIGRRAQSNQLQAVVGVSGAVLEAHVARGLFGGSGLRTVIHNAVAPPPLMAAGPRADGGARVFGYLGWLGEWKGLVPLLDAFEAARAQEPSLRLRVAGRGDPAFVASLRARQPSAAIEFAGHVVGRDFLRGIDALIVPSLWDDPLPTVIIEALSAGVPVIGARRGGIPEMIECGVNGLLFEPTRASELVQAILRLAREPGLLGALSQADRAAREFGDEGRMAAEHERVYERVCEARG
jgi:glycosyltransferase involved in cell wall biosynthesis